MASSKYGINKNNLDLTANPVDDFYQYACGGWIKENPLTSEFSSFGTFDLLRENARKQLQQLILNLKDNPESKIKGSISQKISDLYEMGMDEKRLNKEGAKPLMKDIEKIENYNDGEFIEILSWLHQGLDSSFFSTGVGPDPANSDKNILHVGEPGLGLGDRDYYLEKNENNDKIMQAYEIYVKRLMELIGLDENARERIWKNVITIETEIAKNKMTREERRNPLLHYNLYSIEQIISQFNNIDWKSYFNLTGIGEIKEANISSVNFLRFMNDYLPKLSSRQIKDYLIYSIVSNSSGLMNDEFIDADFELYGKVMSGQEEKKPRWKRAMGLANSMFGEAVGELYVSKYFPPENKEYMLKLVDNLKKSLAKHISQLSWMSDETKVLALEKLNEMKVKIGYPEKWKDYSELKINPEESYLENVKRASRWFTLDNYKKLHEPVDKSEWHMTPQTVNAYYSPVVNEICFPAAILQPPYFDINADDALNYGAIGVVIGHEMTHGFDDQGRQYDKTGNLKDWWNKKDADKFNSLADILVKQFDEVEIAPGVYANGRFTLGENIADQGGLRVALTAYNDVPTEKKTIDGLTPLQRFYLSYAGVWANSIRDEEKLSRTKTDPHSLPRNRVNVTLKNITPFLEEFGIKEGDGMFRPEKERVIIW